MNKRTKLRLRNLRLYLKKNVFNSKYIVRNTSAFIVGASFVGLVVCGSKMLAMSNDKEAVADALNAQVGVASSDNDAVVWENSIVLGEMTMLNPDSVASVMVAMDGDVKVAVEANEFQIVAQNKEEEEAVSEGIKYEIAEPVQEPTETQTADNDSQSTSASGTLVVSQPATEEITAPAVPPQQTYDEYRAPMSFTEEEIREMACVLTLECGNQCYEGQLAVANLIINRIVSGRWGSTVHDVLYAQNQFSVVTTTAYANCMANGPQESCVAAVREAASGHNNIGSYLSYRALWSVSPSDYTDYTIIEDHLFF